MKKFNTHGFSIIELMFTLVLAGILAGIATPSMMKFAKNNRLTGSANDLLGALYSARAEAIKQQLPATVCFTTSPSNATPACDGNGTQGWIMWVDSDGDTVVDAGEEVKIRHEAPPTSLLLVTNPDSSAKLVSYGANGFARLVTNTLRGVVLCDERKNSRQGSGDSSTARAVVIETTGRPSVTKSYSTIKNSSALLNGAATGTCVG